MLKSNGLHHSENLPVKFGFSSKSVPANIAKKLPPQCCSKPLLIPFFNFSHKRPTFAFTGESGYTLGFRRRIAHSGLHAETGGASLRSCAEYLVAASSLKKQPEEADARLWRVSAFPGTAAPLGCGNLFFCYSVVIFAPLPVCQQLEFSIKTIRRPNVHCKTECILLQYSEKSLEWRRYTICPLSSFETTLRK